MSDIIAIKNLTVAHSFGAPSTGIFSRTVSSLPPQGVDEVVIRSISWNGLTAVPGTNLYAYLIWSNINNDFIGTFTGNDASTTCPGTRIRLSAPFPNNLEFRLFHPSELIDGQPILDQAVHGEIAIHMDLISYRR